MGSCASVHLPAARQAHAKPINESSFQSTVFQQYTGMRRRSSLIDTIDMPKLNIYESMKAIKFHLDAPEKVSKCSSVYEVPTNHRFNMGPESLKYQGKHFQYISGHRHCRRTSTVIEMVKREVDDCFPRLCRLPRGGCLIETLSMGNIQFGIPPETIKDCMFLGLEIPTTYVISGELFDRIIGLSMAEFEFPIYYNYFVKRRKVTIITTDALAARIRIAFQETLLGPLEEKLRLEADFAPGISPDFYPRFHQEGIALDAARKNMTVDNLVEFKLLDQTKRVSYGDRKTIGIEMGKSMSDGQLVDVFSVYEMNEIIAQIPCKFVMRFNPPPKIFPELEMHFQTPEFGITMMGSSHGFDPKGNTTGFVLWLNRMGILVDPPPESSKYLEYLGMAPSTIQGIILTHCHADHDAGTFQKILRQGQIKLYTTTTIKESFCRKYTAITGFSAVFLESLFEFHPVKIGEPLQFKSGPSVEFRYAFHTIPCISFVANWGDRSIAYSADTNYSPSVIESMVEGEMIARERGDQLKKFAWDSTVVIHEMGVPPIHTSSENLLAECDSNPGLEDRMFIVHCAKGIPERLRQLSDMDTIVVDVERSYVAYQEELCRNVLISPLFDGMNQHSDFITELLEICNLLRLEERTCLFEHGEKADHIGIIIDGTVLQNITDTESRVLHVLNFYGGHELKRAMKYPECIENLTYNYTVNTVSVQSSLLVIQIADLLKLLAKYDFTNLCHNNLSFSLDHRKELLIKHNSTLHTILTNQNSLSGFLRTVAIECVPFAPGDKIHQPSLICTGLVSLMPSNRGQETGTFRGISKNQVIKEVHGIGEGALIGCMNELLVSGLEYPVEFVGHEQGTYYPIDKESWREFLDSYPGVLIQMLDMRVVESFSRII